MKILLPTIIRSRARDCANCGPRCWTRSKSARRADARQALDLADEEQWDVVGLDINSRAGAGAARTRSRMRNFSRASLK